MASLGGIAHDIGDVADHLIPTRGWWAGTGFREDLVSRDPLGRFTDRFGIGSPDLPSAHVAQAPMRPDADYLHTPQQFPPHYHGYGSPWHPDQFEVLSTQDLLARWREAKINDNARARDVRDMAGREMVAIGAEIERRVSAMTDEELSATLNTEARKAPGPYNHEYDYKYRLMAEHKRRHPAPVVTEPLPAPDVMPTEPVVLPKPLFTDARFATEDRLRKRWPSTLRVLRRKESADALRDRIDEAIGGIRKEGVTGGGDFAAVTGHSVEEDEVMDLALEVLDHALTGGDRVEVLSAYHGLIAELKDQWGTPAHPAHPEDYVLVERLIADLDERISALSPPLPPPHVAQAPLPEGVDMPDATPQWEGARDRFFIGARGDHVWGADLLWESVGGSDFEVDHQPRLHPERYIDRRVNNLNEGAWPGPLLRQGQIETRLEDTTGKVPTLYDVTPFTPGQNYSTVPKDQIEPGSMGDGDGGGPPRAGGSSVGLRRIPGSERPLPSVFRIMDEREYQQALQRGYFQTDGRMNLADEGTVASTRSTGMFYAPWGARSGPQDAQARIVRFRLDPADGWLTDSDSYVKTHQRIPIDRIEKVTPPFTKAEADTMVGPEVVTPLADLTDEQLAAVALEDVGNGKVSPTLQDVQDRRLLLDEVTRRNPGTTADYGIGSPQLSMALEMLARLLGPGDDTPKGEASDYKEPEVIVPSADPGLTRPDRFAPSMARPLAEIRADLIAQLRAAGIDHKPDDVEVTDPLSEQLAAEDGPTVSVEFPNDIRITLSRPDARAWVDAVDATFEAWLKENEPVSPLAPGPEPGWGVRRAARLARQQGWTLKPKPGDERPARFRPVKPSGNQRRTEHLFGNRGYLVGGLVQADLPSILPKASNGNPILPGSEGVLSMGAVRRLFPDEDIHDTRKRSHREIVVVSIGRDTVDIRFPNDETIGVRTVRGSDILYAVTETGAMPPGYGSNGRRIKVGSVVQIMTGWFGVVVGPGTDDTLNTPDQWEVRNAAGRVVALPSAKLKVSAVAAHKFNGQASDLKPGDILRHVEHNGKTRDFKVTAVDTGVNGVVIVAVGPAVSLRFRPHDPVMFTRAEATTGDAPTPAELKAAVEAAMAALPEDHFLFGQVQQNIDEHPQLVHYATLRDTNRKEAQEWAAWRDGTPRSELTVAEPPYERFDTPGDAAWPMTAADVQDYIDQSNRAVDRLDGLYNNHRDWLTRNDPSFGQRGYRWMPDQMPDGGPGETTLAHLTTIREVGAKVSAAVDARYHAMLDEAGVPDPEVTVANMTLTTAHIDDLGLELAAMRRASGPDVVESEEYRKVQAERERLYRELDTMNRRAGRDEPRAAGLRTKALIEVVAALRPVGGGDIVPLIHPPRPDESKALVVPLDEIRPGDKLATPFGPRTITEITHNEVTGSDWILTCVDEAGQTSHAVIPAPRTSGAVLHVYRTGEGEGIATTQEPEPVALASLRAALDMYPTEWLEKVAHHGALTLAPDNHTGRGSYNDSLNIISLPANAEDGRGVPPGMPPRIRAATHETGHVMEQSVPGLRVMEWAYHHERTTNRTPTGSPRRDKRGFRVRTGKNALHKLNKLTGVAYADDEVARADDYPSPYTGREYGHGTSSDVYELFSTTMESILSGSNYADADMRAWALGILTTL